MKIEPKCLAMDRTKQLMFSSYGYMLPCCECDTQRNVIDFKRLGFFKDSFHLSNLNKTEDIKKVLNSKEWQSFYLSDVNRKQVLIPPMHGNGHLVLSDLAIFHYKQTTEYNREGQFTIKWDDPEYNIKWPVKNPILSKRDGGS